RQRYRRLRTRAARPSAGPPDAPWRLPARRIGVGQRPLPFPRPLRGRAAAGMRNLNGGNGTLGADQRRDPAQASRLLPIPQAHVAMRDAATCADGNSLRENDTGVTEGELAQ